MHQTPIDPLAGLDRPIELPEIALLLDVAQALERNDDEALLRLSKNARNPERVFDHVRASSPFTVHSIKGTRNVEHSALWLMPVLTKGGAALATNKAPSEFGSQGPHIARWLQEWFGARERLRTYDYLASYSCMAAMTPLQVRTALEGLVGRKKATPEFPRPSDDESLAQKEAGLPDLAFYVGTASAIGDYPNIPSPGRPDDIRLSQRVISALTLWAGEARGAGDCYRIGMPAPFSEALFSGLMLWTQEVAKNFDTLAWDAVPHGAGNVVLEWDVQNRRTGVLARIYRRLQSAQLGDASIAALFAAVQSSTDRPEMSNASGWHS